MYDEYVYMYYTAVNIVYIKIKCKSTCIYILYLSYQAGGVSDDILSLVTYDEPKEGRVA